MVAITVILAAVIGTFVLGLGDQVQDTAPNTNWDFDADFAEPSDESDSLNIIHDGGDSIDGDDLRLAVSGADSDQTDTVFVDDERGAFFESGTTYSAGSSQTLTHENFEDGSENELNDNDNLDLSDATVRVVWDNGQQSSTLGTWSN